MSYEAPTFVNNDQPALNAANMNALAKAVEAMGVGNGGTGLNTITDGALLVGDGANPIQTLSGTGAVFAAAAGNPRFGPLPVNCGGTGAVTAAQARVNLGLQKAGFVISTTAPADKNVLWINSANQYSISVYYSGAWRACAGTFGR